VGVIFRILGEVEAEVDGRRLDIGHARQRCVLVCLLVDVNRPVSADQLIDRVWADAPPLRARNALAAYISRLRRTLGDVQIVRGPAGYALQADVASVDLHEFRKLVSQARSTDDPDASTALFERALGLWRGEPFLAVDTPWVNELRSLLEAEHLSAALDRNDAALKAGRHAELLGDLTSALQAHPLDERVAAQLMRAQYRSGRQAKALETYRMMRERLVTELGVDPSPALTAAHHEILSGDPPRPSVRPTGQSQSGLPRHPTRLIGRAGDVRQVIEGLETASLVTLTGVGGVGKTRLALASAEVAAGGFGDGVRVCELAPLSDGAALSHVVGATLRLQPGARCDVDDAIVEFLETRELLLILDNCEHILADAAKLTDRIQRSCPRVRVLATSREPLGIEGERVLRVSPLSEADAAELFIERAQASRPDFDPEREPAGAVPEICRRLDGVPLAIELAAARMRAMNSGDVARRLDRLRLLTGGARGAHPRHQSVAAAIDWSYQLLSEPEQELFKQLSVFAGGFDLDAAHAVCGAVGGSDDDTLDLLTGLVDKSMVTVHTGRGAARYGVLETLRSYGRDALQDSDSSEAVASRHAHYYTELMERAAVGIRGADEAVWVERIMPEANSYSAPDYDNLRVAFEHAITVDHLGLALRMVISLPELMYMRIGVHCGEWAQQVASVADPDHELFAAAMGAAARAAWFVGEYPRARRLAGLVTASVPENAMTYCAYPTDVLADVALYEGDAVTCLHHYEDELARVRDTADTRRLIWILYNITVCHAAKGDSPAGLPAAQEAMRLAAMLENPTARSMARCALGRAVAEADPDRAMALFEEAAALAVSVTNNWLRGIACAEDAAIRAVHGDPADTAAVFLELVGHWELGGPGMGSFQRDTLRNVTRLLTRLGAVDDAAALDHALTGAGGVEAVELARTLLRRFA
jgi:predicted ATPase/DNA-binding SARP family transcriptional activator